MAMTLHTSRSEGVTSPDTSEDTTSNDATPATKVSPLSPKGLPVLHRLVNTGIVRSKVPPAFVLKHGTSNSTPADKIHTETSTAAYDPFVTSPPSQMTNGSAIEPKKLSPIASVFTPESQVFAGNVADRVQAASWARRAMSSWPTCCSNESLRAESTKIRASYEAEPQLTEVPLSSAALVLGSHHPVPKQMFRQSGLFSLCNGLTRMLKVITTCVTSVQDLCLFISHHAYSSSVDIVMADHTLSVFFIFGDIRDSTRAFESIAAFYPDLHVKYSSPAELAESSDKLYDEQQTLHTQGAEVLITAKSSTCCLEIEFEILSDALLSVLGQQGEITAYAIKVTKLDEIICRVEYCDISASSLALASIGGLRIGNFTLRAEVACTEHTYQSKPAKRAGPVIMDVEDFTVNFNFGLNSTPGDDSDGNMFNGDFSQSSISSPSLNAKPRPIDGMTIPLREYTPSFSGGQFHAFQGTLKSDILKSKPRVTNVQSNVSRPSVSSSIELGAVGQERSTALSLPDTGNILHRHHRQGHHIKLRNYEQNEYIFGHHNVVDIDCIRNGTDVRTTIMLRNIPNKVDQAMLKDIVDETSRGMYDFMYLRIDFANNCNVGYAFINFEDPYCIIEFMQARAGRRWNRYNSDKIAEISYATIQGRDCLVQKFRNSSVMLEHPSFRPKLFITGNGPTAGREDHFPGPDNQSKMRRSCDNAQHIGLFAPRAGQAFRDEQRRRSSQYDRGTRITEARNSEASCMTNLPQMIGRPAPFPHMPVRDSVRSPPIGGDRRMERCDVHSVQDLTQPL